MGLNNILLSDLEVVVERRACPCTKIGILLKSRRYCMLVSVPVSVVPVPKVYWYSTALGYRYQYVGYRYHCLTACGYRYQYVWYRYHCLCKLLLFTATLPRAPRQRFSSIAMIYICSLGSNPFKNCARDSKNLHTHKNTRNDQRHLFYTK